MVNSVIRAIIFDFDGVIVESADIKTGAFAKLFCDYPDKVDEMISYHENNAGISRYVKFRYFYEQILKQELSSQKEIELGEQFSQIVLGEILRAPLVNGVEEFLTEHAGQYQYFIASGTPEEELRYIADQRNLTGFFQGTYGTPKTKPEIVRQILKEQGLVNKEVVFVGDAESDQMAATETDIAFVARVKPDDDTLKECTRKIRDFTEISEIISLID